MSSKHRCYAVLNELAGNGLSGLTIGNYRHHLPNAGAILELDIRSDTCLRVRVDSDSESPYADVVEYRLDHKTKEAESIYQWVASPVIRQGDKLRHIKNLERALKWAKEESLPTMLQG